MKWYLTGVDAMGSVGAARQKVEGLVYSIPEPLLILVLVVFVIAVFGMLSRIKAVLSGKGTAADFLGIIILLVMLVLVLLIIGSGVLKEISFK